MTCTPSETEKDTDSPENSLRKSFVERSEDVHKCRSMGSPECESKWRMLHAQLTLCPALKDVGGLA